MTMHLVRGMTTLNTKKRKAKGITAADRKAQVEHDKWLTKMGVHPDQLAEKKKANGGKSPSMSDLSVATRSQVILSVAMELRKKAILTVANAPFGVAMMHKSNRVSHKRCKRDC